jgi:hypothetical protein
MPKSQKSTSLALRAVPNGSLANMIVFDTKSPSTVKSVNFLATPAEDSSLQAKPWATINVPLSRKVPAGYMARLLSGWVSAFFL